MCEQAAKMLEAIPAIRAAAYSRSLTIAPIRTSSENWITTGIIKRKIIDSREER